MSAVSGTAKSPLTAAVSSNLSNLFQGKQNIFLSVSALNEFYQLTKFKQIRWRCYKQCVGRVIDIATSITANGTKALNYFSGQYGNTNTLPMATQDSFIKLPGDNSTLSTIPGSQWGCHWDSVNTRCIPTGTWSVDHHSWDSRLYNHPFFKAHEHNYNIFVGHSRWECDDYNLAVSNNDYWKLFVR